MNRSRLNDATATAGVTERRRHARYVPLATAISAVLAGVPVAYAQEKAAASGALDEVVVTAQKRAENLQDVPVSIQALGTQKLEELHIASLDDYVKYLPSVNMSRSNGQGNSGQPGTTHVFMRGINSGGDGNHSGSQPTVGTYLDEQSVTMIDGTLDVHVYDIARVEVLAGPQGTLYGASSEAGTIRIITNKPDPKAFAAGYNLTLNQISHGSNGYTLEGFVNMPISPTAAIRLVGWDEHDGGFINNVAGTSSLAADHLVGNGPNSVGGPVMGPGTGIVGGVRTFPSWDAANGGAGTIGAGAISNAAYVKNNYNQVDTQGGRGALKVNIGDNWTVTPGFMGQTTTANGFFGYDPSIGYLEVTHFSPETSDDTFTQGSLTVEGKIGNLDMVYAGGYLKREQHSDADYSDYSFFYDKLYGSGNYFYDNNGHLIYPAQQVISDHHFQKWSHELRFTTPKELPVRATFGAYAARQLHYIVERYWMPGYPGTTNGLSDYQSIPGWTNTLWLTDEQRVDRDKAIFGEATWDFATNWSLTAGVRFFKADNSLEGFYGYSNNVSSHTGMAKCGPTINGVFVPDPTYHPTLGAPCTNLVQDVSESGHTPRVNLTYKIDADHMLYATYSKGFRPGGANRTSQAGIGPYQADYLTNYELGWKTQWFDHRVRWNGAFFYEDWKNFQFAFLGPNSLTIIVNGGAAKAYGMESELEWKVAPSLSLSTNFTLLPSDKLTVDYCGQVGVTSCPNQVNSFASGPDTTGPLAPSGTRMPSSPKAKVNFVARYTFGLGEWDGDLQAAYVYQTETSQKLRLVDQNQLGMIDAYGLLDLSGGINKNGLSIELFANNALDKRADLTRFTQCTETVCRQNYIIPAQPRTSGIKFGQTF